MTTNRYFLATAIITGLATVVHAVGGEASTIASLTSSTIPSALQVELRAMWHGGTLILLGSTLVLWRAAHHPHQRQSLSLLAWFYAAWGVIWLIIAALMGGQNLVDAPQWVLLLGIAGLIFVGQRQSVKPV